MIQSMINGLTEHNSITSGMQKNQLNSSIYFWVEIKQILESQDLKGHNHIWPRVYPSNF